MIKGRRELGRRKVVYSEDGREMRTIYGDVVLEGDLAFIQTDKGEIILNHKNVVAIKIIVD